MTKINSLRYERTRMWKIDNGFLLKGRSVIVALGRLPTYDKSPIFTWVPSTVAGLRRRCWTVCLYLLIACFLLPSFFFPLLSFVLLERLVTPRVKSASRFRHSTPWLLIAVIFDSAAQWSSSLYSHRAQCSYSLDSPYTCAQSSGSFHDALLSEVRK